MTIIIDSTNYKNAVINAVKDLAQKKWGELKATQQQVKTGRQVTPETLASAIETHTQEKELADKVRKGDISPLKAYLKISDKGIYDFDKVTVIRRMAMDLDKVLDVNKQKYNSYDEIEASYMPSATQAIKATLQLANTTKKTIQSAIGRVESWTKTPVLLKIMEPEEYQIYKPVSSFEVIFGKQSESPGFTVFVDEKTGKSTNIDDVLHAGDTAFFKNPIIQKNYFDLIAEIEKPGSTKKPGKTLRLYTARPVRDRRLYMNAKKVPVGIFLTNDPDRAMGIAGDLSGREKTRDLWKLRIDSRYLVKTLDTGRIKDYQVVGGHKTVPVFSMELLNEGTESIRPSRLSHRIMEAARTNYDFFWTSDPKEFQQFAAKRDATNAAKKIGFKTSDVTWVDVMGFKIWVISNPHMKYLTRKGYKKLSQK